MDELLARLRAATRRVDVTEPVARVISFGRVTIDLDAHLILGAGSDRR